MSAGREPQKNVHQILSDMMEQRIIQQQLLDCRVENRYYTPDEDMAFTHMQKYKLSLPSNLTNRPIGSYDAFQKGTFPAGYFDPANWSDGFGHLLDSPAPVSASTSNHHVKEREEGTQYFM